MVRILIFASLAALSLTVFAACGGGDDTSSNDATATVSGPPIGVTPTKLPAGVRPTPRPVEDTGVAIAVVAPQKDDYVPTVADFKTLPTTTIANETGVTLATLAAKSGADGPMFVAIEGTTQSNQYAGVARYTYADVAESTIMILDGDGHIHMASTSISQDQWLNYITSVAFN